VPSLHGQKQLIEIIGCDHPYGHGPGACRHGIPESFFVVAHFSFLVAYFLLVLASFPLIAGARGFFYAAGLVFPFAVDPGGALYAACDCPGGSSTSPWAPGIITEAASKARDIITADFSSWVPPLPDETREFTTLMDADRMNFNGPL